MCYCNCSREIPSGPNKGDCKGPPYLCVEEILCPYCTSDNIYQIDVILPIYKCLSCTGQFNRSETLRM